MAHYLICYIRHIFEVYVTLLSYSIALHSYLTCLSHGIVPSLCFTLWFHTAITRCCFTLLFRAAVSRCYFTLPFHLPIALCCLPVHSVRLYDQVSSQLDIWEAARQEEEDSNWLQVVSRAEQVRQSQHSNLQSQQFNPAIATRRPSAVAQQELSVQKLHMTRLTGLQSTEQLSVSTSATSLPGASAASRLSDDDEKGS